VLDVPMQHGGLISKGQNVEHQSLSDMAPYPRTMETSNSLCWRCKKNCITVLFWLLQVQVHTIFSVALYVSIGNRVKLKLHWQSYLQWHDSGSKLDPHTSSSSFFS